MVNPWDQHIEVLDDGNVVYHGLPQYLVPSAVDMVRAVIDSSYEAPEEIRSRGAGGPRGNLMAVVRGNVVATPHARTFFDGVVALSQQSARVTPTQSTSPCLRAPQRASSRLQPN